MRQTDKPDLTATGGTTPAAPSAAALREERLKAALRANVARRKAQARARQDEASDNDNRDE